MSLSAAVFLLAILLVPRQVHSVEITPFYTQNQSPMAQIFGLPAAGDAKVLPGGKFSALVAADLANNFAQDNSPRETILLDGENYRYTLALRYGITDRLQVGDRHPLRGPGWRFS